MIRIIHTADLHLGSNLSTRFSPEKANLRRTEILSSFKRLCGFARENSVSIILLAGDVFDSDCPKVTDKEFFYQTVREYSDIEFLYLKGNHDLYGDEEKIPNLKTFSDKWTYYRYGNLTVSGKELNRSNDVSGLSLRESDYNVVVLHGDGDSGVNLNLLKNKNIDYLALGHYHAFASGKLDTRGEYAYSGCLEGRGYDELGDKGFILLELGEKIKKTFVPFSVRNFERVTVDVTGEKDIYTILKKAEDGIKLKPSSGLQVLLTGRTEVDTDSLTELLRQDLERKYFSVEVKDKTETFVDVKSFIDDLSVKGEFVRKVLSSDLPDGDKQEVINYGLKALDKTL